MGFWVGPVVGLRTCGFGVGFWWFGLVGFCGLCSWVPGILGFSGFLGFRGFGFLGFEVAGLSLLVVT